MFSFAPQGGPGPACPDLPPTLLPHAIAAAAPPRGRVRNLAFAGAVYLALAGSGVFVSRLKAALPLGPVTTALPPIILKVWEPQPAAPAAPARVGPRVPPTTAAQVRPGERTFTPPVEAPSDQIPTGLPTVNQSGDRPAQPFPLTPGLPSGTANSDSGTISQVRLIDMNTVRILRQVNPIYPPFARMAHIQGAVVLLMTIDEQGVPADIQVIEGQTALQEEALRAARQWRFEPARADGRPVPARFKLTLNFRLT